MNLYDYYLLSIFYQILYYVKVQKILHNSSWKYARKCECIDTLFQTLYSYQYNVLRTAMWNRLTLPLWKPISQRSPLLQTQIQAVPVWSSLYHSLIYFSSFTFPGVHPTGFSFCLLPGFLVIFILLSSQKQQPISRPWYIYDTCRRWAHDWLRGISSKLGFEQACTRLTAEYFLYVSFALFFRNFLRLDMNVGYECFD